MTKTKDVLAHAIASDAKRTPELFARYVAALDAGEPADFTEHSVRFGESWAPHRVTHYFDVDEADAARVDALTTRFCDLAGALGFALGAPASTLLRESIPACAEIAQVVFGVDARASEAETRLKLYVVLRSPAPALVEAACAELDAVLPDELDPAEPYLVGVDFERGGPADVKLYARLDPRRLNRVIRGPDLALPLIRGARSVVLQQCVLRTRRRQLHLHARDDRLYAAWLLGRAAHEPTIGRLLTHAAQVAAHLPRGRLGPWIVGLPLRSGELDISTGNVYFHVTEGS